MPIWEYEKSKLHYEVCGEGKSILFLHGWGHSNTAFREVVDNLKGKCKCYIVDLPGFGLSDIPDLSWDSIDFANVIKNFIEGLDLKDTIIVGHSFGGKIAVLTANRTHGNVKKLVLIDSAGIKAPMTVAKFIRIYLFKIGRIIKNSGILF
ncbi:alpha/beta hydrolase, partial [bacterium]|nr:alpha/beta hydrolase [bacterium]